MWQKCPMCNGSGEKISPEHKTPQQCPVCKGEKIISKTTGRPPKESVNESNITKHNLLLS